MKIPSVTVEPFAGQRPGTSRLRKKVAVFRTPGYVEAFVQSLFDALPEAVGSGVADQTLVLGCDGRVVYMRHDYEQLETERANRLIERLRQRLPTLSGTRIGDFEISAADDFAYTDPIDGSTSAHQGVRVGFENGARNVYRSSGTGTEGATLRVYLERFEPDRSRHGLAASEALAPLAAAGAALEDISGITGRDRPSVVV